MGTMDFRIRNLETIRVLDSSAQRKLLEKARSLMDLGERKLTKAFIERKYGNADRNRFANLLYESNQLRKQGYEMLEAAIKFLRDEK